MKNKKGQPIELDTAVELCESIREENKKKRFSIWKVMCYFCMKAAKDDIKKRCICANSKNRGCTQVNKRFDKINS